MFDIPTITKCLFGRIGFGVNKDAELGIIDSDLQTSKSGLLWEDAHALVTLENLQAVGTDETDVTGYAFYNGGLVYPVGEVVRDGGPSSTNIYRKLTVTAAGVPTSDTNAWTQTSPFGVWLRSKVMATIKNTISGVFTRKKLGKVVKSVLEDSVLFDGAGNLQDKEVKEGRFVGYQLVFRGTDGLAAIISRISTQFTGVFATPLKLYLYYTGSNDPVKILEVTPNKVNSVQWHEVADCILSYSSIDNGVGGAWYLGYYEDDVPFGVQAINRSNYNFQTGPGGCNGCGNNTYTVWAMWFKWISVIPIMVPSSFLNLDKTIWDWTQTQYYYESKTWGINLQMSVSCDVSALICRQQPLFDKVLQMQFAVDMLNEMAFSTRTNRIQELTKQKAMYALADQEKGGQKGLGTLLEMEQCAIDFDFSTFGSVCAPCDQASGVRVSSF